MRKFVLIFLFFSCEKLDTLGPNPTGMELSTAMEKWDNKNFNNYEYSLDVSCYCIYDGPNNIEIKNNDLFKVNGESVTLEQLQNEYWDVKTIEELFNIIDSKLEDDPFSYSLQFDENYGYPIDIYFDMDEMIADEEIGYTISNFKIN